MDLNIRERSCFFSGHRTIAAKATREIVLGTKKLVHRMIGQYNVKYFICGGALGFDTAAANAVLEVKAEYDISLHMYLPCVNQSQRWNYRQKKEYDDILAQADKIVYATDGRYTTGCMQLRNKLMVNNARYGIVYCTKKSGGTYSTLKYALSKECRIFLVPIPPRRNAK